MIKFNIAHSACEEDSRITIVQLSGDLDISVVDNITDYFDKLVEDGSTYVIVDMENVNFVSSPAVGCLMGCRRRLIEKQGDLVLAGLSNSLKSKLNLMGANRVFRYYSDIKAILSDYSWEYDSQAKTLSMSIPSKTAYVPAIRKLIANVVSQKGYSRKDSFRIETIIDELANNAIEHSVKNQEYFTIDFVLDKEKVEFIVKNKSNKLNSKEMSKVKQRFNEPMIDDESIRGRGLALVKMLSNELNLEIDDDGTRVHVTKTREG